MGRTLGPGNRWTQPDDEAVTDANVYFDQLCYFFVFVFL